MQDWEIKMEKWHKRFMGLVNHISTWSDDRSTQTGAVIVDWDNRIISMGYNGFPSGCKDVDSRHERPAKYLYTEHAERNAIYAAARIGVSIQHCTMYLAWFPCADCARAIIQSGIDRIVCYEPDVNDSRWGEHFKASSEMLAESEVEVIFIKKEEIEDEKT